MGPYGVPPIIVKELAVEFSYALMKIFQTSLKSERLSKTWLHHQFTKESTEYMRNIRAQKIIDRTIKVALIQFVDSRQVMIKNT